MSIYIPAYPIETTNPLFSRVKPKSHCATGKTYDTPVCSNICEQEEGKTQNIKSKLNFPKPVAPMAVSKSAGFSSETNFKMSTL